MGETGSKNLTIKCLEKTNLSIRRFTTFLEKKDRFGKNLTIKWKKIGIDCISETTINARNRLYFRNHDHCEGSNRKRNSKNHNQCEGSNRKRNSKTTINAKVQIGKEINRKRLYFRNHDKGSGFSTVTSKQAPHSQKNKLEQYTRTTKIKQTWCKLAQKIREILMR